MPDDAFTDAVRARDAIDAANRERSSEYWTQVETAAKNYALWLNELAPRFAKEAHRRRKPFYVHAGSQKRISMRRCWLVTVSSDAKAEDYPLIQMTFYVLSDGSWRHSYVNKITTSIGAGARPGLTYDEFAGSFAAHL